MKRYTRRMPPVAKAQRRRRKNYDEGDDFETLDFGPGDPAPDRAPHISPQTTSSKS